MRRTDQVVLCADVIHRAVSLMDVAGAQRWPGCTAIAALIRGDQMWLANAGDCRAVLARGGSAVAASRDHNADDEAERARVVAAGAQVSRRMGNWRLGQAGIQVTR